jgi:hypothetical protein
LEPFPLIDARHEARTLSPRPPLKTDPVIYFGRNALSQLYRGTFDKIQNMPGYLFTGVLLQEMAGSMNGDFWLGAGGWHQFSKEAIATCCDGI